MEKGKRVNWMELETQYLLTIISDQSILEMLDGNRFRNAEIFKIIEEELKKKSFLKTGAQIRAKWKALKQNYFKTKRANAISAISGSERVECPFWEELDQILGHMPVCNVEGVDTSFSSQDESEVGTTQESTTSELLMSDNVPETQPKPIAGTSMQLQQEVEREPGPVRKKRKELIGIGKTLLKYASPEKNVLSFGINEDVKVFSNGAGTRSDLVGVEIKGKRGYINREHFRETNLYKRHQKLFDTEIVESVPGVSLENAVAEIKADPTQQPFEMVNGTPIPLDVVGLSTEAHVVGDQSSEETTKRLDSERKTDPIKESKKDILDALCAKETMDGVDGFLIRLGESLRRLPYRKRALVEIEIMKLVFEAEYSLTTT